MPLKSLSKIVLSLFIIVLSLEGISQSSESKNKCVTRNWQLNYNLGFTEFYGDVSSNGYFNKFSGEIAFATGVTGRKYFNEIFGLGVNLWYSGFKSIKDKRASGVPTNYSLTGNYFDGNINILVDFTNLFWGSKYRKLSFYGTAGTGYSTWNSTLTDLNSGVIRKSGDAIGSDTYKKGAFVVPVALGVNYMLSNNWALNFEMNLRTIINDDVDVWRDGFKYDQLLYTSIGVSYFINKNRNRRSKRVVVSGVPIKPVETFDYSARSLTNGNSGGNSSSEIILVAPVEMKVVEPKKFVFRVQVFATRNKMSSFKYLRDRFNIVGDIYENYQDGIYRYSTGSFSTYNDAISHSYVMRDLGVTDAFVVAYKNDTRIVITPEMKK